MNKSNKIFLLIKFSELSLNEHELDKLGLNEPGSSLIHVYLPLLKQLMHGHTPVSDEGSVIFGSVVVIDERGKHLVGKRAT